MLVCYCDAQISILVRWTLSYVHKHRKLSKRRHFMSEKTVITIALLTSDKTIFMLIPCCITLVFIMLMICF